MGNLLGAPITEKETKGGKTTEDLSYGLSSMQGWRIHMEDAHICQTELYAEEQVDVQNLNADEGNGSARKILLPGTSLFAVFDGHAGSFAAHYAEENFVKILSREPLFVRYAQLAQIYEAEKTTKDDSELVLREREMLDTMENALVNAFLEFDKILFTAILSTAAKDDNIETTDEADPPETLTDDSGCTAVVVVLTPRWIICANAGDSRAIYSKNNGRAIPLSYDHKPDDEGEERRIIDAGGRVAGGRVDGDLAVSRGFGDFRFKLNEFKSQVEQRVSPLPDVIVQNRHNENDEFVVLACDGIWDVVTNHECTQMIREIFQEGETDIAMACEEVLDLCLRKGSKDNMSCIIVQLPALKFGKGGGVIARREKLAAEEMALSQQQQEGGETST